MLLPFATGCNRCRNHQAAEPFLGLAPTNGASLPSVDAVLAEQAAVSDSMDTETAGDADAVGEACARSRISSGESMPASEPSSAEADGLTAGPGAAGESKPGNGGPISKGASGSRVSTTTCVIEECSLRWWSRHA